MRRWRGPGQGAFQNEVHEGGSRSPEISVATGRTALPGPTTRHHDAFVRCFPAVKSGADHVVPGSGSPWSDFNCLRLVALVSKIGAANREKMKQSAAAGIYGSCSIEEIDWPSCSMWLMLRPDRSSTSGSFKRQMGQRLGKQ